MLTTPVAPLILLVDDFDDALEIYSQYLRFCGYQVVTASSGAEALLIAKAKPPTLILMDLRMRNMTGAEALLELRKTPELRGITVVAFTAHAMEDERERALIAGFDHVIAKPCLPNDLVTEIETLLALATPGTPATPSRR